MNHSHFVPYTNELYFWVSGLISVLRSKFTILLKNTLEFLWLSFTHATSSIEGEKPPETRLIKKLLEESIKV